VKHYYYYHAEFNAPQEQESQARGSRNSLWVTLTVTV